MKRYEQIIKLPGGKPLIQIFTLSNGIIVILNYISEMRRIQQCFFYLQGRCRFGSDCRFSHEGFLQILAIRHAESRFNNFANKFEGDSFLSEEAKKTFQFDPNLIDCGLSEQGSAQSRNAKISAQYYRDRKRVLDIVFVSPLNRTLETALNVISSNQIEVKRIIVLPELSEVLSKICDFCGPLKQKLKKYPNFDFGEFDRFLEENKLGKQNWQDQFVDEQYRSEILDKQVNGSRYLNILQQIFPTPLERSQRCFDRSIRALQLIKKICEAKKASKVLIVSHNRILKYMDGRFNKGRGTSFQNCQIRKLII